MWIKYSAPSNFAGSNFATETNLHLCKLRYSKMVIKINFIMDNDLFIYFFFLYFSLL